MTQVSENGLVNNLRKEIKIEESKKLPKDFINRMQNLLGKEYAEFISGYESERLYALRYNPLKSEKEEFLRKMPFELTPVKWCEDGFYYNKNYNDKDLYGEDSCETNYGMNCKQPGKHTFHEAGAYYIQEPSAMAVVEVLEPKPGEHILDLCAAPGGKTTHIAGKMLGKGLLVANEIIPDRARILSQNIERMGIANAVVCNETPERMAEFFHLFFDRVLVDAPCSGEGMFRKDEIAIDMWSNENVSMCADRQLKILEQAAGMVRAGGVLVYSTCTFSPDENEGVVSEFLRQHREFCIEEAAQEKFFSPGEGDWVENPVKGIEHTIRLWPHKIEGEGHFVARLRKADGLNPKLNCETELKQNPKVNVKLNIKSSRQGRQTQDDAFKLCRDFLNKELVLSTELKEEFEQSGRLTLFGEQVYLVPSEMISLQGIKVIRPGLHLGTNKKNRFEPSHALALYLSPDKVENYYEMTDKETEKYLKGETFACDEGLKGWTLLTTGGYSIGFGKAGGGQMKNHYPKGLRKV